MAGEHDHETDLTTCLATDGACPYCRYNLRGLPGDPIRCPECGEHVPRAELILPRLPKSALTPKQRLSRNLQAIGSTCAAPLAACLLVLVVAVFDDEALEWLARPVACVGVPLEITGLVMFALLTRGAKGAHAGLAKYLLAAIPAMVLNLVYLSVSGCLFVIASLLSNPVVGEIVLTACIGLLAWLRPGRWIARLGASGLEQLADELSEKRADAVHGGG